MLAKFETKSSRVKGLSFHSKRPWILAALHNGSVQLWDYKIGSLIDRFDEHEGPVRGVCFHPTQPLFVSGGDDYKIKVWNWKQRRCLFTLNGHLDYIRTVFFHHEHPWIISCSDDQNYQNLELAFHPKEDLVVSASLDQTVRVWDISGLRKKHATPQAAVYDHDAHRNPGQPDIFGGTDAVVKFVLEGHDRETRAWELDTFRGHYNNVSCVVFHPRQELIFDIWDMTKRTRLQTFRQEHDRFWILTAHPELNLFAAGHDSGFIVFKLERERPAQAIHQNHLFYKNVGTGAFSPPRTLSYNAAEHAVLICSSNEGGSYELLYLPRDMSGEAREGQSPESRKGSGQAAVFIGRNRFAVLDRQNQQVTIKDLQNTPTKQFKTPGVVIDIFNAGPKHILMTTSSSVILFDVELRNAAAELNVGGVRYAVWSPDGSMVALLSKNAIAIVSKTLEQFSLIHETMKIKSGAWDDSGVFMYSTQNHIKYALPQGDNGIIRTVEHPIYLTKVKGKNIYCLDRDGKVRVIAIDPTEYRFKLALVRKNYDEVLHIIRTSNLVGQSIIAYLQKKGYPEVALHFVKDSKTRFDLAIECGNLEIALETAQAMDKEEYWNLLATEALRQGNLQIVETAYRRVKNFDKLSFLYLVTGNRDKLKKMLKIAEVRGDAMSRYHNALYLGDVEEQVRLLKDLGQRKEATALLELKPEAVSEISVLESTSELLQPPIPILQHFDVNWPTLAVSRGFFDSSVFGKPQSALAAAVPVTASGDAGGDWGDDDDEEVANGPASAAIAKGSKNVDAESEGKAGEIQIRTDMPTEWRPKQRQLNSTLAVDHVAAGSFDSAMQILNNHVGATNFAPLKALFMRIFQSSRAYIACNSSVPALSVPIVHIGDDRGSPLRPISLNELIGKVQEAYAAFAQGPKGFDRACSTLREVLYSLLFVVVNWKLAAYLTHCDLQPEHRQIVLNQALKASKKFENKASAAQFARRYLELGPPLEKTRETGLADAIPVDYDQYNPFVICAKSFTPIYRGSQFVKCPFCSSSYKPEFSQQLCSICDLSIIGGQASGLRIRSTDRWGVSGLFHPPIFE
ncbi:coatomer WD associated region-domain-containing protein [Chytridium lagenaria]|nr:coatomer WD associated region-domain-containing protein [Chytridium lagenaria]